MIVLSKINAANYLKELPFYKFYWKTKNKRLTNINLLAELPFYEQLSVIKTDQAFSGYARSYKVEIVEKKDPTVQLEASKSSIKNLLNEIKEYY